MRSLRWMAATLGFGLSWSIFVQAQTSLPPFSERIEVHAASSKTKSAIAQAVADAVAQQLGDICEQQNIELRTLGKAACNEKMCLLESTQINQPSTVVVSLELKSNTNEWTISLLLRWKPPTNTTLSICADPSLMRVTRQAYSDIYFDPRLVENTPLVIPSANE